MKGPAVRINVVHVLEKNGKKNKIEWILLTAEPIQTLEDYKKNHMVLQKQMADRGFS